MQEFLGINHSKLPRLKAIFSAVIARNDTTEAMMRALDSTETSQLRFLHIIVCPGYLARPSFTARNITTFTYFDIQHPFPAWMATEDALKQLPALKHL
jgi:hypothetical protein